MSGITALLYRDGREVEASELDAMLQPIAHRGPDGRGVWRDGPAGLGHLMRHTTPESVNEHLPLASASSGLALTADLRLDNRAELIAALDLAGRTGVVTDGALVMAAYDRWGEGCVDHLLGDFAFAVWDGRRQALVCARDHFGVKPLYYYLDDHRCVVGSEIRAVLAIQGVPRRLNETKVADHLAGLFDATPTFYQGILRLPPAHTLTVTRDGVKLRRYWALDLLAEAPRRSDAEHAEGFRALFQEAVRCRIRTVEPLGSTLSGGLDSSAVACMARLLRAEAGQGPLHTFSAIFDDVPASDERDYMKAALAGGGFIPHYVHADRLGPVADLECHVPDEPNFGANLFIHRGMYTVARDAGVRVVLDGFDGDTTVSHGVSYLAELARAGRLGAVVREGRGLSASFGGSVSTMVLNYAVRPHVPEWLRRVRRTVSRRPQTGWIPDAALDRDFARRIGVEERAVRLVVERQRPARSAREDHGRRLTWDLLPLGLEAVDHSAGRLGVEPRFPFFDRRLVEYCLALPGDQKLSGGLTRMVMRRALAGVLPEEIRWRRGKSNLSPNFHHVLRTVDAGRLANLMSGDLSPVKSYADVSAVRAAFDRLGHANDHDMMRIWRFVSLLIWLRQSGLHPASDGGAAETSRRDHVRHDSDSSS